MARLARAEVFDPDEVAIAHVDNRTARRCFLMVDEPVSGKKSNHRKVWIEQYLEQIGIALLPCLAPEQQRLSTGSFDMA